MSKTIKESYKKLEKAFRKVLKNYVPESEVERLLIEAGLEAEFEQGGQPNGVSEDTLEDIAWDFGLENGWIKDGKWNSEKDKGKAFALAYKEAGNYVGGGELNEERISYIITGDKKI